MREATRVRFGREADNLVALQDPALSDGAIVLTAEKYRTISKKYGGVFDVGTGAEALLEVLRRLDLRALQERLMVQLNGPRRKQVLKRMRVIRGLQRSGSRPEWMVLTVLPVLPPDLRPMIPLADGRLASSDLNDLYVGIIRRNERLRELLKQEEREADIFEGKRMLQEAVDDLIGGARGRRRNPSALVGHANG